MVIMVAAVSAVVLAVAGIGIGVTLGARKPDAAIQLQPERAAAKARQIRSAIGA